VLGDMVVQAQSAMINGDSTPFMQPVSER
jgi:hypothetical protein